MKYSIEWSLCACVHDVNFVILDIGIGCGCTPDD